MPRTFPFGLFDITCLSPVVSVGDPLACATNVLAAIDAHPESNLILLPELSIGGYTCGDLFAQRSFLDGVIDGLEKIRLATAGSGQLVVIGAPLRVGDALMNTAVAIADTRYVAIIPKQYLPNYREFYEARHFTPGSSQTPGVMRVAGQEVPLGIDLLIRWGEATIGIEICEDLWMPVPPSSLAALAGANVLLNLSASNETIGKATWRRELITSQSGRCLAAYAYASAGPTESTTDLVFGGHCLVAENGRIVSESRRVGDTQPELPVSSVRTASATIDLEKLEHDRQVTTSWHQGPANLRQGYRIVNVEIGGAVHACKPPKHHIDGSPFVPKDLSKLSERCTEIFAMQAAGLAKRVSRLSPKSPLVIGVSGGLDSTLALLVAVRVCDSNGWPRSRILGMTLPGFGTTTHTLQSANALMQLLGISSETIDIRQLALDTFRSLGHSPLGIAITPETTVQSLQNQLVATPHGDGDLVFENVQARLRTYLLMSRGFVLGTGDMSEQALGWCTYNADHMSMYNVNTSIPKTLVRFLVRHAAETQFDGEVRRWLLRVADTPISPELLPPDAGGNIRQNTEESIGPYELHDFFLFHFVRNGFTREKILYLAQHAVFSRQYDAKVMEDSLEQFVKRFFANQFKRSCMPDGPKVGSVSLSPRGDWRMPSDADRGAF